MSDGNKANIIKASYKLQHKVGAGPLDEEKVKESQKVIEENNVDFAPLALDILDRLNKAVQKAQTDNTNMSEIKAILTAPVMELKANAAIFKYALIGNMANIMLSFLETITQMDNDAVEIVKAHHNTLHMIVVKKMSGDGGAGGKMLLKELQQACDRYYQRKAKI